MIITKRNKKCFCGSYMGVSFSYKNLLFFKINDILKLQEIQDIFFLCKLHNEVFRRL